AREAQNSVVVDSRGSAPSVLDQLSRPRRSARREMAQHQYQGRRREVQGSGAAGVSDDQKELAREALEVTSSFGVDSRNNRSGGGRPGSISLPSAASAPDLPLLSRP